MQKEMQPIGPTVHQENTKYISSDMMAMKELPDMQGKLAMHDVNTVEVLSFSTSAFSKKTTHSETVNTISATDDRERPQSRKKKE